MDRLFIHVLNASMYVRQNQKKSRGNEYTQISF